MNKAVKYLVIFIVSVSLGGVLAAALLPKSFNIAHEMEINQPIEVCWDGIRDDSLRLDWVEYYKGMKHVEGEPNTEGAVRDLRYVQDTIENIIKETLLEIDSPFHYKFRQNARDLYILTKEIRFIEQDSNRTLVKTTVEAKSENRLFKFMMFGMKSGEKERTKNEMLRFKELMEKGGLEASIFPNEKFLGL